MPSPPRLSRRYPRFPRSRRKVAWSREKKPDEALQLLGTLYDREQTQHEFMLKAPEADDNLTPGDVMKFWQDVAMSHIRDSY
eukprot:SAG25_NODE_1494_length_2905_cov_1.799715_4_plen_82_part_00